MPQNKGIFFIYLRKIASIDSQYLQICTQPSVHEFNSLLSIFFFWNPTLNMFKGIKTRYPQLPPRFDALWGLRSVYTDIIKRYKPSEALIRETSRL